MPHQCVHCSKIIASGSREILEGCSSCKGRFFFFVKDEQINESKAMLEPIVVRDLSEVEKRKIEEDVRGILNIEDDQKPVILDLESVRVLEPGKFELDLVSLMNRKPIVFKLQEGKYIIDL